MGCEFCPVAVMRAARTNFDENCVVQGGSGGYGGGGGYGGQRSTACFNCQEGVFLSFSSVFSDIYHSPAFLSLLEVNIYTFPSFLSLSSTIISTRERFFDEVEGHTEYGTCRIKPPQSLRETGIGAGQKMRVQKMRRMPEEEKMVDELLQFNFNISKFSLFSSRPLWLISP